MTVPDPNAPPSAASDRLRLSRAEAQAILSAFGSVNARLLAAPSATLLLEELCCGPVTAQSLAGPAPPLTPAQAARLDIRPGERIGYRYVRLFCGPHMLSEAENWYCPGRLTAEINRLLDETETPFGRAVRPLSPRRRTLDAMLLWPPLPVTATGEALDLPVEVLEHRALLSNAENRPFAEVRERYRADLVAAMEAGRAASSPASSPPIPSSQRRPAH